MQPEHPGALRGGAWRIATVLLATVLSSCSPALNWRQMDLAEADGLRLRFPCKPDRHERSLRLEGVAQPLRMAMWSCQAGGAIWVLSATRLNSATDVSPALRAWSATTEANLAWADRRARQQAPQVSEPRWERIDAGATQVPGMTPNPDARAWRIQGLKPGGDAGAGPMTVQAWHFSHGLTVFQAAIWRSGEPLPRENGEDAAQVFQRALHFPG